MNVRREEFFYDGENTAGVDLCNEFRDIISLNSLWTNKWTRCSLIQW